MPLRSFTVGSLLCIATRRNAGDTEEDMYRLHNTGVCDGVTTLGVTVRLLLLLLLLLLLVLMELNAAVDGIRIATRPIK